MIDLAGHSAQLQEGRISVGASSSEPMALQPGVLPGLLAPPPSSLINGKRVTLHKPDRQVASLGA